jgi:hypothetical protein
MMYPPPTTQPGRWRHGLIDQVVNLGTGQEWHSHPVYLQQGVRYERAWIGTVRSYVGVWPETAYQQIRARGGAFPFVFGSDAFSSVRAFVPSAAGQYRLVVRVGVFTPPGQVRAGLYRL